MTLLLLFPSTGIQPAVETDLAQGLIYTMTVAVNAASEINNTQTVIPLKTVDVFVAIEDNVAQGLQLGVSGSGSTVIVLFATAYGNVDTPVAPLPTGVTATVYKRVSVTVPAPTLDSEGFPV